MGKWVVASASQALAVLAWGGTRRLVASGGVGVGSGACDGDCGGDVVDADRSTSVDKGVAMVRQCVKFHANKLVRVHLELELDAFVARVKAADGEEEDEDLVQFNLAFAKQGDGVADAAEVSFNFLALLHRDLVERTEVVHEGESAGGGVYFA